MAKFLVTGGAGFIGGNFLHLMVRKYPNDQFVCVDALTYAGNIETIESLFNMPNFKFIHENICNREKIFSIFENEMFDYVINFAAESHVDRSIVDSKLFLETNVIGVINLLDASKKYNVKRFHQVSTDEVYGDLPIDKPELLFKEDSSLKPSNPYSASKASADLLTLSYFKTFNLPVTISRCSNNFGPYQFLEKLIPLIIDKALNDEKIPLYGDGKNIRDWIYVEDHCNAIDLIVRNGKNGEIYNIGSHNEKSNIEITKLLLDILNKPHSLITFIKDRPGHDLRYAIDSTKLKNELGFEIKFNFEEAIKKTVSWYLNNEAWIKNVKSGEYLTWMKRYK